MPVNKNGSNLDEVLSTISASSTSSTFSTSGSGWVTTSTPGSSWLTVSDTDSYIWSTSTTPITASGSTITITYPPVTHEAHECEFPFFDTYNLDSPKGREKFVEAFKEYLLASFQTHINITLPVYA